MRRRGNGFTEACTSHPERLLQNAGPCAHGMLHRHLARRSASEIGMRVGIVIYDGFDELDALAPYEVLKNAAATGAMI